MTRVVSALDWVSRIVARLTELLCGVALFAMLALLSVQVGMRYLLGAPPSWAEEVAIGLFGWTVLLYATVGVREHFHVTIDFLPDRYATLRRHSDRLVMVVIFGFGGVMAWAGWQYVLRTLGQHAAASQLPIEALHLAAPVSGALLMLHALALFLRPADEKAPPVPIKEACDE